MKIDPPYCIFNPQELHTMLGVHVAKTSKVLQTRPRKAKAVGNAKVATQAAANAKAKAVPRGRVRRTMLAALEHDVAELKLTAVQIYTHGPRSYRANRMNHELIRQFLEKENVAMAVHGSYLTAGLWNVDADNFREAKRRAAVAHLKDQLETCEKIGAMGLVVHLPRKPVETVIEALQVPSVKSVLDECKVPILLEMVPVKDGSNSDKAYVTPDQINCLVDSLDFLDASTWGICVDTAHLWGAGVDVTKAAQTREWLANIEHPEMIKLMHLNGSAKATWDSGRDEHYIAFGPDDDIWGAYGSPPRTPKAKAKAKAKKSGVAPIIEFCVGRKIPVICEINRGLEADVRASLAIIDSLA